MVCRTPTKSASLGVPGKVYVRLKGTTISNTVGENVSRTEGALLLVGETLGGAEIVGMAVTAGTDGKLDSDSEPN